MKPVCTPSMAGINLSRSMIELLAWCTREVFVVAFLNEDGRLIRVDPMFEGDALEVSVSIADIVRAACRLGAHSIVVSHNHLTGCAKPSEQDERFTRRLRLALLMVDISLADHLIVAGDVAHSMEQQGPWSAPLEEYASFIR